MDLRPIQVQPYIEVDHAKQLLAIRVACLLSEQLRESGSVNSDQAQYVFDTLATAMVELSTQTLLEYLTLRGGVGDGRSNKSPRQTL